MNRRQLVLAIGLIVASCCVASAQDVRKVTVTLVRWPYT